MDGRAIQPTNNQNFSKVNDPHIQSELNETQPGAGDEARQRRRRVEALDQYTAQKAYVVVVRHGDDAEVLLQPAELRRRRVPPDVPQRLDEPAAEVGIRMATVDSTVRAGGPPIGAAARTRRPAGTRPVSPRAAAAAAQQGGARVRRAVPADRRAVPAARRSTPTHIAHTGPNDNHVTDTVDGRRRSRRTSSRRRAMPIGPTWQGSFLLGADQNGRDVAVRLLYGGRNSLEVGVDRDAASRWCWRRSSGSSPASSAASSTACSRACSTSSGPTRSCCWGSRSAPSLALGGISTSARFTLQGNSLLVPAFIIGIVYIPYVAKPIRGQVLGLREQEFVDAARVQRRRVRCGSCGARSCRTSPRRSSSSSR